MGIIKDIFQRKIDTKNAGLTNESVLEKVCSSSQKNEC